MKMKRYLTVFIILLLGIAYLIAVPPVPDSNGTDSPPIHFPSEIFRPNSNSRTSNVPDSILVLRAQFSDIIFDLSGNQPDAVPHDKVYFERWMFHLSSYFHDASHGKYHLTDSNYTIWDDVFTLPKPMSYYGDNDNRTKRISEFVKTVLDMADADINYANYDSFIIFHAGAGQEADLSGNNKNSLWSTFITRKTLQAGLDPENDSYPGIQTNEKLIKEIVIVPESQWHPDNVYGETSVYSIFGVLAHLFGHQLGLPTLYDNYSGDGSSFGIGNFGIMGTGLWNAKGFVPPLPCAWSRYYLGWETDNLIMISADALNQQISYPMANNNSPKLYQVFITEKEYFLIENRQYNPDNSTINGFPNFSFQLLPPNEQDFYPPPNENVPRFNFMKNTYLGCEWDFFLPGPGYSDPPGSNNVTIDGSGLFIWHIDENIIEQKFTPDFQYNSVNGNAAHKGVDLEEADGIQHLDSIIDQNSFGSPFDSFRLGNNDYFGELHYPESNAIWLPTAESYYGGIPLSIRNISDSGNSMSFSVFYKWQLKANYFGENPFPSMFIDIDGDEEVEIVYPMPSGRIYIWKNEELIDATFQQLQPLSYIYSYDTINQAFYFPCHIGFSRNAVLRILHHDFNTQYLNVTFPDKTWAAPVVINPNHVSQAFAPLNHILSNSSEILIYENFSEVTSITLSNPIACNMMYDKQKLYVVTKEDTYFLSVISLENFQITETIDLKGISAEDNLQYAILADWNQDGRINFVCTVNDSLVYGYDVYGNVSDGFPVNTGLYKSSVPSFVDLDGNGFLDVLIGGENTFTGVNHLGKTIKPSQTIPATDSLNVASGVIAIDLDFDGIPEILGNMSKNRFCVWKNSNNNEYHLLSNYVHSFLKRSRNYPQPVIEENQLFAYLSADDGMLFRQYLGQSQQLNSWITEYSSPGRVASYQYPMPPNQFISEKLFIDEHTYVYPNPYSKVNNRSIFQGELRPNAITIKFLLAHDAITEIKIFDIAGNKVFEDKKMSIAYIQSDVEVDVKKYASGMYFAVIKANNQTKMLKFAIEK
jgi:M6 family metalloprotease-like protein